MVSPYLLRRPRSLDEAAAQRPSAAPKVDDDAHKAVLEAMDRFRLSPMPPEDRPARPRGARLPTRSARSR